MEKTIIIDGKEVRLKSTAGTPMRYKAQFGKDYLGEVMKLYQIAQKIGLKPEGLSEEQSLKLLESIDFEVFYNIVWVLAKTANKEIKPPLDWLDEFEEFPLVDILPEIQDLIASTIQTKKK
ncbi:hypothetical protein [Cytobacillus praedii]|uniref:Uncharacterized protein n=1 Tax=Cytobacillus praedii TaxID=1742358 RepID=A0A4R1AP83_9BACI|nr:hypothetical protein [Cytobacillus praedii]TCJ01575.1 hypothetical protein E0Y62_23370 [Cytobacillus praedii]